MHGRAAGVCVPGVVRCAGMCMCVREPRTLEYTCTRAAREPEGGFELKRGHATGDIFFPRCVCERLCAHVAPC